VSGTGGCSFSYSHFGDIVTQARGLGFAFVQFTDNHSPEHRVLLLRHDVDLDMMKAVTMARIEAEIGVQSTYFLRVAAPFYNVFDRSARKAAREIVALGHGIGLHFDTQAYPESHVDGWESIIASEARVLAECVERPVRCVSFHRPTPDLLNVDLNGIISAYAPRYFSVMKYLSDSGMRWREGCICTHLSANTHASYQILIHPCWWSHEPSGGVEETLLALERERRHWFRAQLEANISSYRPAKDR
jgi:hypothetical protein